ncbi:MAG: hypothetical protein H7240_06610 [Glaciimonas sp.]|nr:hypothetical protein [Glaciimonas sp.]
MTLLEAENANILTSGATDVIDVLGRQFEFSLIKIALKYTHDHKDDAAIRLGIGRNTITRKIQKLGIAGAKMTNSFDCCRLLVDYWPTTGYLNFD